MAELIQLAASFRRAIVRAVSVEPHIYITLRNFPRGACGDASLLLARYFKDEGLSGFDYVLGQRDGCSHAWLERRGLIVDITGDQFEEFSVDVFVGRDSVWHKSFNGEIQHPADYSVYGERIAAELEGAYCTISGYLT